MLKRLQIPFETASPNIDEQPKSNESTREMVSRLAEEKARQVALDYPAALIIGSDQSVECAGTILGKPGNPEKAKEQLILMSGKTLTFHTGLCVLNSHSNELLTEIIDYQVTFRNLNENEIDRYLLKDKPFNCAGSFKSEQLGIALIEKMSGNDPNALIGLPLIELCKMLRQFRVELP